MKKTCKKKKKGESGKESADEEGEFYCFVCGCEISEEEYENFGGMCWECWDDQLTEESLDMFGDLM